MSVSRRGFLRGATAAAAAFLGQPRICSSETRRFVNPLKIPALLEGAPGAEGKLYELSIAAGRSEFLPGYFDTNTRSK